jgi:hypothetical protein
MSAFGGKAEMTNRKYPLVRSLLGVKRTSVGALHMSAFDPKRTSRLGDRPEKKDDENKFSPRRIPR